MTHVWISTSDGDLLRADQVRQINVVEGLRVVTTSGSQFLLAKVEGREPTLAAARALATAIADGATSSHAAQIDVVREEAGWKVRLTAIAEQS
ncbi:hypothetical protein KGQ19_17125 [Catenulispora sp. NL8]|uniref:Uncharacterized protein n=1 Tax=Catenulispora pinistramenti TaxID=2705254 RepID=A0ABS5KRB6_9ACTN|nr:hypothetical protein [Catenulispora pinistramenti]MBS2548592.1 hypothetical protein [Catenulispora pinistramenti]